MDEGRWKKRIARLVFRVAALLWLPVGMIADEVLRTGSWEGMNAPFVVLELLLAAPFGLPLALACRRVHRSGYPGAALVAWVVFGCASAAGLLGTFPAGVQALAACLPVWMVVWRLARPPRRPRYSPWRLGPERTRSRGPLRTGR